MQDANPPSAQKAQQLRAQAVQVQTDLDRLRVEIRDIAVKLKELLESLPPASSEQGGHK